MKLNPKSGVPEHAISKSFDVPPPNSAMRRGPSGSTHRAFVGGPTHFPMLAILCRRSSILFGCGLTPLWSWAPLLGFCAAASTLAAAETNTPTATITAPAASTNAAPVITTNAPVATAVTNTPATAPTNAPAPAAAAAPPVAPPPLTPEQMFEGGTNTYNNWVEFTTGGFITRGNQAQFQQRMQARGGAFGGIQDFHVQGDLAKGTSLAIDGRALFDESDYKLRMEVTREKLGYLRFSFNQFRTWSNGDGGFYPASGSYYPLSGDAFALDRGEISFEAGLTLEKYPKVIFKYTRTSREGDKASTSWGPAHPTGTSLVRGISPSFYDLNEHSDIFQLDVTHHIKATEFGLGLRYESGKLDDALKIDQYRNEPADQKITDHQGTSYDLFSVHAFTETWLKKNLMVSSGYSYSDLNNDFSGSRNFGSDFDVAYSPVSTNGLGYYGMNGGSRLQEYVMDVNLLYKPTPHLSLIPSVRAQKEYWDANFSGFETLRDFAPTAYSGSSDRGVLDVRERLDLRYTGITNWVLYARADFTEGQGNLAQDGGFGPVGGIGSLPVNIQTDDSRFFQKYSAGARWYPTRRVTLDAGGYYKLNNYDYANLVDSTTNNTADRYPGYLVMQNFETYDANLRLTVRPWQNVTVVSRYEYQLSTIQTRPDPISGLAETDSSKMTSHILAEDVSWSPWSRLSLQAGASYVVSDLHTPASDTANDFSRAILTAQNNYWTLNFSSSFVVDDKTDLRVGYFYYRADDYQDNANFGLPLGAGAEEHGVTAAIVRRISQNLRATLKYGFSHYQDEAFGGFRDYTAHLVSLSLQYRF
jgi:hypothetical protein